MALLSRSLRFLDLKQVPEFALSHARILDDLLNQPSRQFARMYRHDYQPISDRFMHRSMTAPLPDKFKAHLLQYADEFLGSDTR